MIESVIKNAYTSLHVFKTIDLGANNDFVALSVLSTGQEDVGPASRQRNTTFRHLERLVMV